MKRTLERGFKVPEAVAGFSSGGRILIAFCGGRREKPVGSVERRRTYTVQRMHNLLFRPGFAYEKGTSAKSSLFGRACTSPKSSGHEPLVPLGRWDVFRLPCKLGCVRCSSVWVLPCSEPEEETKPSPLVRSDTYVWRLSQRYISAVISFAPAQMTMSLLPFGALILAVSRSKRGPERNGRDGGREDRTPTTQKTRAFLPALCALSCGPLVFPSKKPVSL